MIGLTDSRSAIGALGAIQGGCTILLSPVGGVLSYRVPKRSLLIWIRLGLSALMAIMTALIVTKNVQVWHLFGRWHCWVRSWRSANRQRRRTCSISLAKSPHERNRAELVGDRHFLVSGPSIGGLLIPTIGTAGIYIAAGSGYLLSAILLSRIPIEGTPTGTKHVALVVRTTLTDLGAGVRYSWRSRCSRFSCGWCF